MLTFIFLEEEKTAVNEKRSLYEKLQEQKKLKQDELFQETRLSEFKLVIDKYFQFCKFFFR